MTCEERYTDRPRGAYIDIRKVRNGWIVSHDGNEEYVFNRPMDVAGHLHRHFAQFAVDADVQGEFDLEEATGGPIPTEYRVYTGYDKLGVAGQSGTMQENTDG